MRQGAVLAADGANPYAVSAWDPVLAMQAGIHTQEVAAETLQLKHDPASRSDRGVASLDYLWWPPHKVSGQYLSAWLGHVWPSRDVEPLVLPPEVVVSWPHEMARRAGGVRCRGRWPLRRR